MRTGQQELLRQMESLEELLHVCEGTEEIIQQMKDHRILDEAGRSIVSSLLAGCGDAVKLLIQISTLVYILFGMFGVPLKDRKILPRTLHCILREPAAGFAEQNGRNAELKRPECGLVTAGAKSKKSRDTE